MLKQITTTSFMALLVFSPMADSSNPLKDFPGVSYYEQNIGAVATMNFASTRNNDIEGIEGYPFQKVGQTKGLEDYFLATAIDLGTSQDFERDKFACYVDYPNDQESIDLCVADLKVIHKI